jgi:hypothetical protein
VAPEIAAQEAAGVQIASLQSSSTGLQGEAAALEAAQANLAQPSAGSIGAQTPTPVQGSGITPAQVNTGPVQATPMDPGGLGAQGQFSGSPGSLNTPPVQGGITSEEIVKALGTAGSLGEGINESIPPEPDLPNDTVIQSAGNAPPTPLQATQNPYDMQQMLKALLFGGPKNRRVSVSGGRAPFS